MMARVLDTTRAKVISDSARVLSPSEQSGFESLVERRAAGEPLPYITGRVWFHSVELLITPDVLVPRPETELLVEWALSAAAQFEEPISALDVGTGCGAIALAVAHEAPGIQVHATDVSREAVGLAQLNAERLGVAGQVTVSVADLLPATPAKFDLVVANLPYVADDDPDVAPEVTKYEPTTALFAGPDGLREIRRLLSVLPRRLSAGAAVGLEIGWRQGHEAKTLVASHLPGANVTVRQDLAGHDRFVIAENVP
jgi:release factor glutamine methyltransferase